MSARASLDLTAAGVAEVANAAYIRVDGKIAAQRRAQRIPGNTCPVIDAVLRELRRVHDAARAIDRDSECVIARGHADAIERAIAGLDECLEDIRTANDALRDIGKAWYGMADDACAELGDMASAALRAADAESLV